MIVNESDLIRSVETVYLGEELQDATAIELLNGQVIVLSLNSIGMYKNKQSISDPLGNGLIHFEAISPVEKGFAPKVEEFKAGYVGLMGGYVLLLGGFDVRLFTNKSDALYNRNEVLRLAYSS